jgi:hypothetical protein
MRTTAYLFIGGLMGLMACSSGSTAPSPTAESTTSAEVCSPTLGVIASEAGSGEPCGVGATCTKMNDGSFACAPSGGW